MLQVRDLMSTELFTLQTTDSLWAARSMMSLARIRHIPIVDEKGWFKGLLTHRDILSAAVSQFAEIDMEEREEIEEGIPLCEIMRTEVTTVPSDMSLKQAAKELLDHHYGCLPVVDDGLLVGIITEADFLRLTINLMDAVDTE